LGWGQKKQASKRGAHTVGLIIFLTALGLLPFFIVTMTAFLKISVVMLFTGRAGD
jgi:flagellar biosynthesis protein FliP